MTMTSSAAAPSRMRAVVASRVQLTADIVEVKLEMVSPYALDFHGGQFVTVYFAQPAAGRSPDDGTATSGRPVSRSYSIASRLTDRHLLRFVLRMGTEPGSAALAEVPVGTPVELTGPHGRLALDETHAGDVVFCATGTGASPLVPLLDELAGRRELGRRRLVFWGVRTEADLAAFPELPDLCRAADAELLVCVSAASHQWAGARGRITDAVLTRLPELHAPTFYLVGGPVMVRHLREVLIQRGIERGRQIRNEAHLD